METRVNQIELNGLNFQYYETGDISAPPLVALHALGQDAQSWNQVAAVLGKKYRVLALDQRGHGGSSRAGTYSFEVMSEDLHLFANALGLESFTLVGHSMGGTVAYLFSETHPSRVERLVVEDTPPPFPGKPLDVPSEPSEPLPFDYLVVPSIFHQLNEPNPEWWTRLTDITSPTLIVGGGSTSHIPQEKLREVSELIPNCELVTIEGAGHGVHFVNQADFLDVVTRFLDV
ncbi:alpha/beta fold hydrolase [Alicyclobacillus dauci]|uniref:Alpha/beta hydrolase n=1 Tax=Alicyclobacillus dauci TaxID=1475485 RepID=A0ABY6Z209_9BACL|nr:alpha/beta hydrolase [Alicyclobacillus dauci]WAH36020.1 alpha/beta hydrolase [Alicyclobacillus dauci]